MTATSSLILRIIERDQLRFSPDEQRLGRGAFGFFCKCQIAHPEIPNTTFVAKVFDITEDPYSVEEQAMLEATRLHIRHPGIISPIGFHRAEYCPAIIYPLWNGFGVHQWIRTTISAGLDAPSKDYVSISHIIGGRQRLRKQVFALISALVHTVQYMHANDLLHNDLNVKNILLHFSEETDAVYIGIAEWGHATRCATTRTYPDSIQRERQRYYYIAPEYFTATRPPFARQGDVYSLGHVILKMLHIVDMKSKDPQLPFADHLINWAIRCTHENPDKRPRSDELTFMLSGAIKHNVLLNANSGLRPLLQ